MDTRSRIELLGGLRIEQGTRVITRFRTQKTAALLAYLAYYRERFHPREHLIDLLWPEADLASGRNSLSIALSSLRHQLEPPGVPHGSILRADRSSVQLNPEAVNTDVAEFEVALQQAARAGSANERVLFLASAVERYGGELLPGFYEEWCLTERDRLAGTHLGALHQLVEALERTGDLDRALGYARRAVSADPLREEGHQQMMRLLAAAGQPTAALRQYRELEQLLDEQLGEAPSAMTRQLAREIERQTAGHRRAVRRAGGAAGSVSSHRSALPSRLPTGTVTFLFTDIEGSTTQWEKGGEAFTAALATHHTVLRRAFRSFGGHEVKETGDGFIVAFERAGDALACAVAGQRALADHPWPQEVGAPRVRMALHTGDVELQGGEYRGLVLHHASRMLTAGHGGQILCSEATGVVVQRRLEAGIRLTDLGMYRLRDVEQPERLFQVDYPEMPQRAFPPLRAEAGYARNLPLQFTRFIGREQELGQLEELLLAEQTRLVTLTGPGGTGKSRLALELAGRLVERFHGAVWFVPLADVLDPQRIVDAVIDALRLPRSPSLEPLDQVVEMLSRQPSLLVLDNFEHLVEEGASLVQTLLQRLPALKCLVTSRQLLGLSGEREFVVPALQTPAGASGAGPHSAPPARLALEQLSMYESVQLFIDRAQVVKPDFQVTNQNAAAVAELCNRLEGIPLALELAAARAQVLTPGQMLRQLAHRFEFLVSRRRDGAKRHQTLHAAMDWSYRLLPPELQRFFARLSVFRGGWTLEAAEAVAGGPAMEERGSEGARERESADSGDITGETELLPSLSRSLAPSLVPALDYLAQLRECSLVSAEEDGEETRFRMLETLREYAVEQLEGVGEKAAVLRRHADFSLALAEEAAPELNGLKESTWLDRLEREHDNLRAALAWSGTGGQEETGLRLGGALWRFWEVRGYLGEGRENLARLLALPGARECTAARAKALFGAGRLARFQGDYVAARALSEEGLAIFRELGDRQGTVWSLNNLAAIARAQREYEAERAFLEESLAILRELGDPQGIAWALSRLGSVVSKQGDYGAAQTLLEESLAICRELGHKHDIHFSLNQMGWVAREQGEYGAARALHEESLAICRERGDKRGIADSLTYLAWVACSDSDAGTARALFEESLAIYRELGDKASIAESLSELGEATSLGGEYETARALLQESLAIQRELGDKTSMVENLERLAAVAGMQDQPRRAARLFGAAEGLCEAIGAPLPPAGRAEHNRSLGTARAALSEEAFAAAWTEGRAMALDAAVAYALQEADDDPPRA